jgi:hypothetical protein
MSVAESQPVPKPKRHSLRSLLIFVTVCAIPCIGGAYVLYGCFKATTEGKFAVKFIGMEGPWDFQGLMVTLPNYGMRQFESSPDSIEWRYDSMVIYIKNLGDGNFEIQRNGSLLGKAKTGDHVQFADDGRLVTKNK